MVSRHINKATLPAVERWSGKLRLFEEERTDKVKTEEERGKRVFISRFQCMPSRQTHTLKKSVGIKSVDRVGILPI